MEIEQSKYFIEIELWVKTVNEMYPSCALFDACFFILSTC